MSIRFPYARPDVTQADIDAVAQSMRGQYLTQGPTLAAFEAALSEKLGAKHAVVCNSGTAALHLAYLALSLGRTRGLLTSPITFLATANAARMCEAPVAFADVDPDTGNVTVDTVRSALDRGDRPIAAVTAVHLGGRACDMAALRQLTAARGIALVEDACHAPLARYRGENGRSYAVGACTHSDVAVFSFHPIKHVAMGEGGAVLTNDDGIAERARLFRNHGMVRDPRDWRHPPEPDAAWYYEMHEIGWNYRASEPQCALGLSQLARLEEGIGRRRAIAARYRDLLSGLNHVALPAPDEGHVWHLYAIAVDFEAIGRTRGAVMKELAQRGIGTQVHYIPVNRQPYYEDRSNAPTPGADRYYRKTLSIPMYPSLTDADVDFIAQQIRDVLQS
jgi:UDP-4-amino-4,6-dideoxy-N-acetyl-beta-L-altrosamine transaminase